MKKILILLTLCFGLAFSASAQLSVQPIELDSTEIAFDEVQPCTGKILHHQETGFYFMQVAELDLVSDNYNGVTPLSSSSLEGLEVFDIDSNDFVYFEYSNPEGEIHYKKGDQLVQFHVFIFDNNQPLAAYRYRQIK